MTNIGYYAFKGCTSLTNIHVDANNANYKSIDGNLYTKDGKTLIQYAIGKTDTAFIIPDSVTRIGDLAFNYCSSITNVTIPDSAIGIGNYAFKDCSKLTSITIPNSVTSIGVCAFYGCNSLTSVTISDSVTDIGIVAFYGCSSLANINVNANNVNYKSIDGNLYSKDGKTLIQYAVGKTDTSFTIPDSVTNIDWYAFYNCTSLTNVTIPNSVTNIGDYAFFKCLSLSNITYKGSKEQWKAITKGTVWYTVDCIIHCINGDISIQD